MKGKITYRIKDRQNDGAEQNWVKDFGNVLQLARVLWVAVKQRAETIHLYYHTKK